MVTKSVLEMAFNQSAGKIMVADLFDKYVRISNSLERAGLETVEQLLEYGVDDLKRVRNIGKKSVEDIRLELAQYRLCLRNDRRFLIDHYPLRHIVLETRLCLPISRLDLSSIVNERLARIGVQRIGDLVHYSKDELYEQIDARTLRWEQKEHIDWALFDADLDFFWRNYDKPVFEVLSLALDDLALPDSLRKMLQSRGITELSQLLNMTRDDLVLKLGFDSQLQEVMAIEQALAEQGLGLFPHDPWAREVGLI